MTTSPLRIAAVTFAAVCLFACPPPPEQCLTGDEEVCDGGSLPEDFCNSPEEARTTPRCQLTLGTPLESYISTLSDGGLDRDWYSVQMPATLTARSLLHVTAGYTAPQTAVNFSVGVIKDDEVTSVVGGIDRHGAAAPKPVDLIVPFSEGNTRLLLLVSDEGGVSKPRVDNRNPYSVRVEVLDNPDTTEPNDTTPSPISLTPQGAISQGTTSGYLATDNDVDKFSFAVPAGARQIIYLRITGPTNLPPPPPTFRLSYQLFDPANTSIAEGVMENQFLPVDLATAKIASMPGTYTLVVQGYRPNGSTELIKGDLRLKYDITVQVMPDLDTNEPNEIPSQARPVAMTLNGTQTLTGKLAHIPDDEWWALDLPANNAPTVLRYSVTVSPSGGRFSPTAALTFRQLRVLTEVTQGATLGDKQVACRTDANLCPKGYDPQDTTLKGLVDALCNNNDPPQCLHTERNEELQFSNLRNMVGAIPVPPHGGTVRYLLFYRDVGQGLRKYADDRDYQIRVSWESDADDAARVAGPVAVNLSGATSTAAGVLSHGFGRLVEHNPNRGQGLRGPNDYDAVPTDIDRFQLNFPAATDLSWNLEWEIDHPDGGSAPPGDIALDMAFCLPGGPGNCTERRRVLAYTNDSVTPWYLPQSFGNGRVLFTRTNQGGSTLIRASPVGCWCFQQAYTAQSRMFLDVLAVDRDSNAPITYRIRSSTGAYPQTYTGDGGAVMTCGGISDGGTVGCGFGN